MPPCGICQICVASMCSGPSVRRPMNTRPGAVEHHHAGARPIGKGLLGSIDSSVISLRHRGLQITLRRLRLDRHHRDRHQNEAASFGFLRPFGDARDRGGLRGGKSDGGSAFARFHLETRQRAIDLNRGGTVSSTMSAFAKGRFGCRQADRQRCARKSRHRRRSARAWRLRVTPASGLFGGGEARTHVTR